MENQNVCAAIVEDREKSTFVRHQIALILLVTLVIAYIDRVNVAVLVVDKSFLEAMGIANDPMAKGSLMTVFLVCYGLGSLVLSPVGDWLGPRKATLISIALWGFALVWGGLAGGFLSMVLSRAVLGLGESMHYPMQSKFVKNWFPAKERGKANATWLIGLNIAPMVAMPLFAWMIPVFGWRENFFFHLAAFLSQGSAGLQLGGDGCLGVAAVYHGDRGESDCRGRRGQSGPSGAVSGRRAVRLGHLHLGRGLRRQQHRGRAPDLVRGRHAGDGDPLRVVAAAADRPGESHRSRGGRHERCGERDLGCLADDGRIPDRPDPNVCCRTDVHGRVGAGRRGAVSGACLENKIG